MKVGLQEVGLGGARLHGVGAVCTCAVRFCRCWSSLWYKSAADGNTSGSCRWLSIRQLTV